MKKFELIFVGAESVRRYKFPRYRRWHATEQSAVREANVVRAKLDEKGVRGAHQAIVYGPGLGRDGASI